MGNCFRKYRVTEPVADVENPPENVENPPENVETPQATPDEIDFIGKVFSRHYQLTDEVMKYSVHLKLTKDTRTGWWKKNTKRSDEATLAKLIERLNKTKKTEWYEFYDFSKNGDFSKLLNELEMDLCQAQLIRQLADRVGKAAPELAADAREKNVQNTKRILAAVIKQMEKMGKPEEEPTGEELSKDKEKGDIGEAAAQADTQAGAQAAVEDVVELK